MSPRTTRHVMPPTADRRQFASDTEAPCCPSAWQALTEANHGHAAAYGDDAWTAQAVAAIRDLVEHDCAVFFTATGTAANALALAALCRGHQAVAVSEHAHLIHHECGAAQVLTPGLALRPLSSPDGRLTPEQVTALADGLGVHGHRLGALSIANASELGTVYDVDRLTAVAAAAHARGWRVHCDGARFANAVAATGATPAALSWRAGVDVLVFGGAKNGLTTSEAVVVFDRDLADDLAWRHKQAGQLAAKGRFWSAPWLGLIRSGAWLANARHANAAAARLAAGLATIPGTVLRQRVESNAVFISLPVAVADGLRARGWRFHALAGAQRLVCSWDTSAADVDAFVADARALAGD